VSITSDFMKISYKNIFLIVIFLLSLNYTGTTLSTTLDIEKVIIQAPDKEVTLDFQSQFELNTENHKLEEYNHNTENTQINLNGQVSTYQSGLNVIDRDYYNNLALNEMGKEQVFLENLASITPSAYTSIAPIVINGDAAFATAKTTYGWTGSGTSADPYIIEGYNITGDKTQNLIDIRNTNVFFIIRDNYISNGTTNIYLSVVNNALIENNIIILGSYGINLASSGNSIVQGNSLSNFTWYPLQMSGPSAINNIVRYNTMAYATKLSLSSTGGNNIVNNNTFINSGVDFYAAFSSSLNKAVNNTFIGGSISVSMDKNIENIEDNLIIEGSISTLGSNYTQIYSNVIINGTISLSSSLNQVKHNIVIGKGIASAKLISIMGTTTSNVIVNNTLSNSYLTNGAGIYVTYSSNNIIANNTLDSHQRIAIELGTNAISNTIMNNTLAFNRFGIYLIQATATSNLIASNIFFENTDYAIYNQLASPLTIELNDFVRNFGKHINILTTTTTVRNNFWDDHVQPDADINNIVDTPYTLPYSKQDATPRVKPYNSDLHTFTRFSFLNLISSHVKGIKTLEWTSSFDTQNHQVLYDISISFDNKQTWELIQAGHASTVYDWNTSSIDFSDTTHIMVTANDGSSSTGLSITTWNYIVDNTPPTIELTDLNNNTAYQSGLSVNISYSDNYMAIWLRHNWNGGINYTNTVQPITTLPATEGVHVLNVYSSDYAGNEVAKRFVFIIDNTSPTITLPNHTNESTYLTNSIINLDISDVNGIDSVEYNWDDTTNVVLTTPYNVALPSTEGTHTLTVTAKDQAENIVQSTFVFNTDELPSINSINLMNNSVINSDVTIVLDVSDTQGINQVIYNWDGDANQTITPPLYHIPIITTDGPHILNVYVQDVGGFWINESYRYIVDNTAPTIESITPNDGANITAGSSIDLTIYDESGISIAQYNWDGSSNRSILSTITAPLSTGIHILNIYISDNVGNWLVETYHYNVIDNPPPSSDTQNTTSNVTPTENTTENQSFLSYSINWIVVSFIGFSIIIRSKNRKQFIKT